MKQLLWPLPHLQGWVQVDLASADLTWQFPTGAVNAPSQNLKVTLSSSSAWPTFFKLELELERTVSERSLVEPAIGWNFNPPLLETVYTYVHTSSYIILSWNELLYKVDHMWSKGKSNASMWGPLTDLNLNCGTSLSVRACIYPLLLAAILTIESRKMWLEL